MKRFLIYTLICSLATLMSCNESDEVMNILPEANGKKVTVTANIQGDAATRVALTPDTDADSHPIVKVEWKESDETFKAYADGVDEPILFTQTTDTEDSKNLFEGTLPETPAAEYTVYYGAKDYNLTAQNGTLNEAYVLMQATVSDFSSTIDFEHKTAILKPTFKVNSETINASITKIVMDGIKNPKATTETGSITITPSALDDIYIFLPTFESYEGPHTFTFFVNAGADYYEATLTIPDGKNIEAGKFYTAAIKLTEAPYLTFIADEEQVLVPSECSDEILEDLEFCVGDEGWNMFGPDMYIYFGDELGSLRLRGSCESGTAISDEDYFNITFENDIPVACMGDIRTLVDHVNYKTVDTSEAKFIGLFRNCSVLTSAPDLPATELAVDCYRQMFLSCTSLTSAPDLPATTLAANCYYSMFSNCTSLTTAPDLPATKLAVCCYDNMFYNCISLTTAPALPATTLADYYYKGMFQSCTSLTTAPALPAETLAGYCYYQMFSDCISLTTAPALPAKTLAIYCYDQMFFRCSSLTTAPALPATTLTKFCYANMFRECTLLTTAPALPAETLEVSCYHGMFSGCFSLTAAPVLSAKTLVQGCYYNMFQACRKLSSITMLATNSDPSCMRYWVDGVAASGTFTKAKGVVIENGINGIPSGWTVKEQE